MIFPPLSLVLSCLSASLLNALAIDSPAEALSNLERRAQCNADNCFRALSNRPSPASAFCTSYITSTPGTITVTAYASTITPLPKTLSVAGGTSTATSLVVVTVSNTITQYQKRSVTSTTAVSEVLVTACTSSPGAPAVARISSACSCFLLTSATATVSTNAVTTLLASTFTVTTAYFSTTTVTVPGSTTTISTPLILPGNCANLPAHYISSSNIAFITGCGQYYLTPMFIDQTTRADFKACIDYCAGIQSCLAITWAEATNLCYTLYAFQVDDDGNTSEYYGGYDQAIKLS